MITNSRVVVTVSTSRSRDGLETYFLNVSVSSRSRQSVGRSRSRSRPGLKAKRLGLVSVSDHNVSFTSGHLKKFYSFFHFHTKQARAILAFYPRDAMLLLARVFATATCPYLRLSVRMSVCHTPVLCLAERKQDREMYTI